MRKPSRWKHQKKYNKKLYQGNYEKDISGERVFVLKRVEGNHKVTFESHELAKIAGWKKVR